MNVGRSPGADRPSASWRPLATFKWSITRLQQSWYPASRPHRIIVSQSTARKIPSWPTRMLPFYTASGYKDTAKSIIDTGEFCVSLISDPLLEASNYCSIDAPEEIDEWKLAGLSQRKSESVGAPHVAESAFSMECKLAHKYVMYDDSGRETGTAFFGRITRFHIKEFVLDTEDPGLKLAPEKLRIVSRLGGITYARTISGYEIPRPQWEKAKEDPDVQKALAAELKTIDLQGSQL